MYGDEDMRTCGWCYDDVVICHGDKVNMKKNLTELWRHARFMEKLLGHNCDFYSCVLRETKR